MGTTVLKVPDLHLHDRLGVGQHSPDRVGFAADPQATHGLRIQLGQTLAFADGVPFFVDALLLR